MDVPEESAIVDVEPLVDPDIAAPEVEDAEAEDDDGAGADDLGVAIDEGEEELAGAVLPGDCEVSTGELTEPFGAGEEVVVPPGADIALEDEPMPEPLIELDGLLVAHFSGRGAGVRRNHRGIDGALRRRAGGLRAGNARLS